jgi:hypothetical protein
VPSRTQAGHGAHRTELSDWPLPTHEAGLAVVFGDGCGEAGHAFRGARREVFEAGGGAAVRRSPRGAIPHESWLAGAPCPRSPGSLAKNRHPFPDRLCMFPEVSVTAEGGCHGNDQQPNGGADVSSITAMPRTSHAPPAFIACIVCVLASRPHPASGSTAVRAPGGVVTLGTGGVLIGEGPLWQWVFTGRP